ncbi:hypothetical protein EDB83DRAFT_1549519 [Lactarius deliciosus]|nr:hypothetical protein EDB83DRAFT_1549519 [Lactarius deliciosus]
MLTIQRSYATYDAIRGSQRSSCIMSTAHKRFTKADKMICFAKLFHNDDPSIFERLRFGCSRGLMILLSIVNSFRNTSMSQVLENVNMTRADTDPGRGDHPYLPQSAPIQEPRGAPDFVDDSGPIFSMYLEMATEEDKKMVEGWKADADGILIFVRHRISTLCTASHPSLVDWFVLCCCRVVDLGVHPGHSTEPSGHFQLLSRKYLPDSRQSWIQHF